MSGGYALEKLSWPPATSNLDPPVTFIGAFTEQIGGFMQQFGNAGGAG